jgi:predicted cupin superfamily sugar epimerase
LIFIAATTLNWTNSFASYCSDMSDKIIKLYDLQPAGDEGGLFKLTYKLDDPQSDVPKSTAIFYFLNNETKSLLHKVSSDIIYHFYSGDPVTMIQLKPDGTANIVILGNDILHGQQTQVVVPKNTWIGSYVSKSGCYALMGTTMTPGFD